MSYRGSSHNFKPFVTIKRPVKLLVIADHIAEEIKANPEKNGLSY